MELDGYCSQLSLAFEHQGEQHYSGGTLFVENEADLTRQQELDAWKLARCKEHNVTLFEVPQIGKYVSQEQLKQFIKDLAIQFGIPLPDDFDERAVDLSGAYMTHGAAVALEELQNIAKASGGSCLSTLYLGNRKKIEWQCAKGHIWAALPQSIKYGYWCPKCGNDAKKRSVSDMQKIAEQHGGVFVDFVPHNGQRLPSFRCAAGHEFIATNPTRSWCPMCDRRGTRLTLEELQSMAARRGGACLSSEYVDSQTHMEWECDKGHRWSTIPAVIRRGGWCKECYLKEKRRGASA